MRALRMVLLAILLTPVVLIAAFSVWKWADNVRYARQFFDDKVEIARVIASKRWHDFNDGPFACTYAAVEFSEDTAARIRGGGPNAYLGNGWRKGGQERWDVNWQPTPVGKWTENRPADPLYECLQHFPEKDANKIKRDLEAEGSLYYRHGQIATFLSVKSRIAATLRYGD